MARPIRTGALTFGLVTVPVGLYSASPARSAFPRTGYSLRTGRSA